MADDEKYPLRPRPREEWCAAPNFEERRAAVISDIRQQLDNADRHFGPDRKRVALELYEQENAEYVRRIKALKADPDFQALESDWVHQLNLSCQAADIERATRDLSPMFKWLAQLTGIWDRAQERQADLFNQQEGRHQTYANRMRELKEKHGLSSDDTLIERTRPAGPVLNR